MDQAFEAKIDAYAETKRLNRVGGTTILRGTLRDEKEGIFKYYVKMDIAPWPNLFPLVWEEDGQIRRRGDNHVNPDGSLCLDTNSRQSYLIKSGQIGSLIEFHEEVLLPHLARQYDYHNGYLDSFKGNELAHGPPGIIEGYQKLLGLQDKEQALGLFFKIFNKSRIRHIQGKMRNQPCPCLSGKKVKYCDHTNSILHKYIDHQYLKSDYNQLKYWSTYLR
ncbi:MAG: SEC-C domain-containing protein [Flavobacteriales bacterium]|nr:SEC-C domain-containing protein [Flavobacteriales bacterium]